MTDEEIGRILAGDDRRRATEPPAAWGHVRGRQWTAGELVAASARYPADARVAVQCHGCRDRAHDIRVVRDGDPNYRHDHGSDVVVMA